MKHKEHTITEDEARDLLSQMVAQRGSQKEVAKFLKVSDGYLSDILNGNRAVSDEVARKLGYSRVAVFVRVESEE